MASGSLRRVLQLKTVGGQIVGQMDMIYDQEIPSNGTVLDVQNGQRYRVLHYDPPHTTGDSEVYVALVEPVES